MKIIDPYVEVDPFDAVEMHTALERAIRTCYKSEDRITKDSAQAIIAQMIKSGHHSTLEHRNITVRIICDRGVTHEIVRHRLVAYSQESTRYVNYAKAKFGKELTFIRPFFWNGPEHSAEAGLWEQMMLAAERYYLDLIDCEASPQEARSVLPNSLKTEIVMTANLREWRHIFTLRCSAKAHPQMRQVMQPLQGFLEDQGLFTLFGDIKMGEFPDKYWAKVSWADPLMDNPNSSPPPHCLHERR